MSQFLENQPLLKQPRHVAIIMDGNGRWAQERGKARKEGHRQGLLALRQLIESLPETGVQYLTVYAFSSENWSRPLIEVQELMDLLLHYLKEYRSNLLKNDIRLHSIGRIEELPRLALAELKRVKKLTKHCTQHHLVLALNYGARNEVVDATKRYINALKEGTEDINQLDFTRFSNYLDTAKLPDPDLFIRTSGEQRLSNFLLLQLAYAELYFAPVYWPDFSPEHFKAALEAYKKRERRYGLTGEQLRDAP